jgi:hypothetical protein
MTAPLPVGAAAEEIASPRSTLRIFHRHDSASTRTPLIDNPRSMGGRQAST